MIEKQKKGVEKMTFEINENIKKSEESITDI